MHFTSRSLLFSFPSSRSLPNRQQFSLNMQIRQYMYLTSTCILDILYLLLLVLLVFNSSTRSSSHTQSNSNANSLLPVQLSCIVSIILRVRLSCDISINAFTEMLIACVFERIYYYTLQCMSATFYKYLTTTSIKILEANMLNDVVKSSP